MAKLGTTNVDEEALSLNDVTGIEGGAAVEGEVAVKGYSAIKRGSALNRKRRKMLADRKRTGKKAAIGTAVPSVNPIRKKFVPTLTKVHRLRFLKQSLYPVRCLAWEPENKRLAVSRSEGSVELWSFHVDPSRDINDSCWYVERRIPGAISRKIETLVWCRRRLFATGTAGLLLEFDASFNVVREIPASAGGIVAITANEKLEKIALASIDGTIIVYDVTDEGLVYDRTLEKRRERIMSLAWHINGETLVSGCKGYVLIWDFASGRVKSDIALSKSLTKRKGKRGRLLQKSSLVWTIKMLADGTIVTGDSEGNLSLWDLETATLKTQFNTHKGPILALCVAADEETIWCAGVDPRVVEVKRNCDVHTGWQLGHVNHICTRDVHALAHVHVLGHTSEGIVFGGDDPRLTITCVRREETEELKRQLRLTPGMITTNTKLPSTPACVSTMISLSRKSGILVSRVNRGIEIWQLGSSSTSPYLSNSILPLDSEPTKLALIPGRKGVKDYYTSAAINADASFLCLSDKTQTDVFRLSFSGVSASSDQNGNTQAACISKMKALNGILSPNLLLSDFCLTTGDDILVTITANGRLEALRIHSKKCSPSEDSIADDSNNFSFQKMVMTLSSSSGFPKCMAVRTRYFDGGVEASFAAVGFTSGRVDVVDLLDGKVVASLPVLKDVAVTAIAFSHDATEITAVYANREVAFFHVDSQMTSYWPRASDTAPHWREKGESLLPIHGVIYLTPTKLLMYSDGKVYKLQRHVRENLREETTLSSTDQDKEELEPVAKKVKLAAGSRLRTIPSFQIVHFVDALDNGELVVAETTLEKIEESLPEPLLKKKYGT